jgi:zinc D-Ala-D-Ala carboxypeptidase
MQLTPHFSLEELTISQNAARAGLTNIPGTVELANLTSTAEHLEKVRTLLGSPIIVSSGYRSLKVNALAGSKPTSQHTQGKAIDFTCPAFGDVAKIVATIKTSDLVYDQRILEYGTWVHISFNGTSNRKQVLIIDTNGTRSY